MLLFLIIKNEERFRLQEEQSRTLWIHQASQRAFKLASAYVLGYRVFSSLREHTQEYVWWRDGGWMIVSVVVKLDSQPWLLLRLYVALLGESDGEIIRRMQSLRYNQILSVGYIVTSRWAMPYGAGVHQWNVTIFAHLEFLKVCAHCSYHIEPPLNRCSTGIFPWFYTTQPFVLSSSRFWCSCSVYLRQQLRQNYTGHLSVLSS